MKLSIDNLLQQTLPQALNLQRNVRIRKEITQTTFFDLTDDERETKIVLEKGLGKATYTNLQRKELYIIDFEDYKKQLNNCAVLQQNKLTRQCDYLIFDTTQTVCILNEITSGSSFQNLQKEIKKGNEVEFSGGKFEKVQQQLLHSLRTLYLSDEISKLLLSFEEKICLCSYKIHTSKMPPAQVAFNRALMIENNISNEKGIQYAHKEIESLGFQYRRIGYIPFKI